MISSFQVIENLKAPTPGDLAKGVYESLVNTTMGLFISIVFLSAFFFMKNKVSRHPAAREQPDRRDPVAEPVARGPEGRQGPAPVTPVLLNEGRLNG
jgi:hypothetical protein